MSEKRKDKKGRNLKEGESQRKNGSYDYRYTDHQGKRRSVYAATLDELREKEEQIKRDLEDGIDYAAGEITVIDLVERYLAQKQGLRNNTKNNHNFVFNLMKNEDFAYRHIKEIKPSDAKIFLIKLHDDGYSYSTITNIRGVLRPAFEMAVEDDIVHRNPFTFRVVDVVPNDSAKRNALTAEQKEKFLNYLTTDTCRRRYVNEVTILLGTGLRISELYGLTFSDVDFQQRRIRVNKQLQRTVHGEYLIEKPKTKNGERFIPMLDDKVYIAFQNVIKNRKIPTVEYIIDGCTGFLFLNKDGKPKITKHLEQAMKRIVDKYNATHDDQLPAITPHVLRHTFCTDLANADINLKSLQYLMGHSDIHITMNTYTHSSYDAAEKALAKVLNVSNG